MRSRMQCCCLEMYSNKRIFKCKHVFVPVNLEVKKVDSKLKPVDQGFHIKKPRGGIFAESPSNLFKQIPSDLKSM